MKRYLMLSVFLLVAPPLLSHDFNLTSPDYRQLLPKSTMQINHFSTTATLAEINAGKVLVGNQGTFRRIRVLDVKARVHGTFAGCTSVDVSDEDGDPVIQTFSVTSLTNDAMLHSSASTSGLGMLERISPGQGIKVSKTGLDCANGTSIDFFSHLERMRRISHEKRA